MVLNIGELERVCLLRFVDRGSMKCNGSVEIDDWIEGWFSSHYLGSKLSLIYTVTSIYLEIWLLVRSLVCLVAVSFMSSASDIPILSCRCPISQLPSALSFSCPVAQFTGSSAAQMFCPTKKLFIILRKADTVHFPALPLTTLYLRRQILPDEQSLAASIQS